MRSIAIVTILVVPATFAQYNSQKKATAPRSASSRSSNATLAKNRTTNDGRRGSSLAHITRERDRPWRPIQSNQPTVGTDLTQRLINSMMENYEAMRSLGQLQSDIPSRKLHDSTFSGLPVWFEGTKSPSLISLYVASGDAFRGGSTKQSNKRGDSGGGSKSSTSSYGNTNTSDPSRNETDSEQWSWRYRTSDSCGVCGKNRTRCVCGDSGGGGGGASAGGGGDAGGVAAIDSGSFMHDGSPFSIPIPPIALSWGFSQILLNDDDEEGGDIKSRQLGIFSYLAYPVLDPASTPFAYEIDFGGVELYSTFFDEEFVSQITGLTPEAEDKGDEFVIVLPAGSRACGSIDAILKRNSRGCRQITQNAWIVIGGSVSEWRDRVKTEIANRNITGSVTVRRLSPDVK